MLLTAIASTNAVIAGLIVFEAFKLLDDKWNDCRHVSNLIKEVKYEKFN